MERTLATLVLGLGFLSLAACTTGAVTSSSRLEPSAPVGSLSRGRESSASSTERAELAPAREVHVAQHAHEPRTIRFECRSCVR